MHPVEHFFYYTCTLLPLVFVCHPIHFLYAKFHADIAPIGGHDGFSEPGGNGDFHWLHHAKYECNCNYLKFFIRSFRLFFSTFQKMVFHLLTLIDYLEHGWIIMIIKKLDL